MFTAFLPIKYESERVLHKNFRLINKKPLFFYILNTLSKIELINEIVIDFDQEKVSLKIEEYFSNIKFIQRDKNLLDPKESVNKLIESNLQHFKNDYIIQTHVTNPLLKTTTIQNALNKYVENLNPIFSVTKHQARFYNSKLKPINHDLKQLLPTQHLDAIYEENSNFYIFSKTQFLKYRRRINNKSEIFEIPKLESIDIDDEQDLELVKKILAS